IRARADAPAKTARPWLRRSALAGSLAQRLLLQRDAVDGGETGSERRRASPAGAIVAPLLARQGLEIRVLHDPGHPGRHVDVASPLAAHVMRMMAHRRQRRTSLGVALVRRMLGLSASPPSPPFARRARIG